LLLVVVCVAAIRFFAGDFHRTSRDSNLGQPASTADLSFLAGPQPGAVTTRTHRLVYPYSVVPGGVTTPDELRDAAAHDTTVAEHYADFDYRRARVVEVKQPQLVYLSYRRGKKIFWMRKQASLHPGEKLITDGKITARNRCGNQVSVLPHVETSPEEPTVAELDRPDALASGIQAFPANLASSLLDVDPGVSGSPTPGGGGTTTGGIPGGFVPGPIGGGGGTPGGGGSNGGGGGGGGCTVDCNPPPVVPEPGTIVLVLSGAAAIVARYRRSRV
jgi:uncharacterized membrane protein YgcG